MSFKNRKSFYQRLKVENTKLGLYVKMRLKQRSTEKKKKTNSGELQNDVSVYKYTYKDAYRVFSNRFTPIFRLHLRPVAVVWIMRLYRELVRSEGGR